MTVPRKWGRLGIKVEVVDNGLFSPNCQGSNLDYHTHSNFRVTGNWFILNILCSNKVVIEERYNETFFKNRKFVLGITHQVYFLLLFWRFNLYNLM